MKHLICILAITILLNSCSLLKPNCQVKFNRWDENLSIELNTHYEREYRDGKTTELYWITLHNLSKTENFESHVIKDGKPQKKLIKIYFELSDGGDIEYSHFLDKVEILPQKKTEEKALYIPIPTGKDIISVKNVRIEYTDEI